MTSCTWPGVLLAAWSLVMAANAIAQQAVRPEPLKSGVEFAGAEVRALQHDDFANPGMLWVARGEKLWQEPAGKDSKSCASCHGDAKMSMLGAATRYPLLDPGATSLVNLEGRIMACREQRQRALPLKYESEELLALTAYVRHQSRGMPVKVVIEGQSRKHFEAGRDMYHR
ncbi:MAG TPA: sulfur oxidation c-type cytochrome SoxA, partial [Burkholderiales bacterium]|nr:sulfur oxidation c-type cytochrome SoxA [Burkholderiales bacterium]